MHNDVSRGFTSAKIKLPDDGSGKVEATLIKRMAKENTGKAILYIHGFVDYFFQYHLADWANDQGWNFYAIDLRKYGRSLMEHHEPNMINDLREYFEEIDVAVTIIKEEDKNEALIINGHSTGGLISSLYAHYHRNDGLIDGLILNSPFFEFNKPLWFRKTLLPLVAKIGLKFPKIPSPEGLEEGYAKSIHKDYHGEWDFDLTLKPIKGFEVNFGWISAIYFAQRNIQDGLDIHCPILIMYSSKSIKPGKYNTEMHEGDSVLNVEHISRHADIIGSKVRKVEIKNGVHDLILSKSEPREETFKHMAEFLSNF